MFPPVAAYALYLFFNASFGEGSLSRRGWFNVIIGGLMALSGLAWLPFYLTYVLYP